MKWTPSLRIFSNPLAFVPSSHRLPTNFSFRLVRPVAVAAAVATCRYSQRHSPTLRSSISESGSRLQPVLLYPYKNYVLPRGKYILIIACLVRITFFWNKIGEDNRGEKEEYTWHTKANCVA